MLRRYKKNNAASLAGKQEKPYNGARSPAYNKRSASPVAKVCVCVCVCVFIQNSETAKHLRRNLRRVHIIYIYMSVSSLHKLCRWVLYQFDKDTCCEVFACDVEPVFRMQSYKNIWKLVHIFSKI